MPELPEVETICRSLQQQLDHPLIQQVIIRNSSLRWPITPDLALKIRTATITRVTRRAKYLLIATNRSNHKPTLIIHLGMTGKLMIVAANTPITTHDHVDFILNNHTIIRYNDPRRFGAILLTTDDPLQHNLLKDLGLEPFDQKFTAKYLYAVAQQKTCSIKQLIMDHKIVVGIGNIYANEALFAAKINPVTLAKKLSLKQISCLITHIKKILTKAILTGGTTLKDYMDPTGKTGKFIDQLKVYGKANNACINCNFIIKKITLVQRSTFYCPNCQS